MRSFANSMLWILKKKKIRMDRIENYQLVSSCQAASCPPWKEVKISTQKQIYNIWQDHYWEFFWLKQNAELTLEFIHKLSSPCVGQQRQNCCDSASSGKFTSLKIIPSDCFEFERVFLRDFLCFFISQKTSLDIICWFFCFFACNTNQFVIWCSDQWPV